MPFAIVPFIVFAGVFTVDRTGKFSILLLQLLHLFSFQRLFNATMAHVFHQVVKINWEPLENVDHYLNVL